MTEAFRRGITTAHVWAAMAQPLEFLMAIAWAEGWALEEKQLLPMEPEPEFVAGLRWGLQTAVYRAAQTVETAGEHPQ